MEHQLLIGKFTLESLTSGLYVSPLDLYREYVQNAADSIDEALEQGILKKGEEKISITVSESERIIKISDNGTGVGANDIYSNLIDIGNSKKRHSNSRGFRGIGRLSGLGYCQKLKFLTSIHGEEKASWHRSTSLVPMPFIDFLLRIAIYEEKLRLNRSTMSSIIVRT